ncbi:Calx-beta domain-containing protein [Actinoplanes sp. NPDC049599]|uniref:Calx-beta domain-containing protein n=1 Tax=Actinoplanes sp. NPDC049599 TaxID=3363903 RepID=UPI0037A15B23
MRYSPAHAAKSGSVPFMLRGPKSTKKILSVAVAGVLGLVPTVVIGSPAMADGALSLQSNTVSVGEAAGSVTIKVNRAGDATQAARNITWTTTDVTAETPDDYTGTQAGAHTIPANVATPAVADSYDIVIPIAEDNLDEIDETFTVTVMEGVVAVGTATVTITDNDSAPAYELEIDDLSPGEAAGSVAVTAKLLAESGKTVTIPIASADVSAKAGQDYTAIPGATSLTVLPGQTVSDTVNVSITNDLLYEESDQTFTVTGTADATVTGTDSATVTISDNEFAPQVTIDPISADEGDPLKFKVNLSGLSERAVTVSASTADGSGSDLDPATAAEHGTAKAGEDYTAVSNTTITFPAATMNVGNPTANTEQTLTVNTTADATDEVSPEDMHATLSNATIADLGTDIEATGAINDDDDSPTVSLLPSTRRVPEGNTGKTAQTFTVNLSKASAKTVAVNYDVTSDTAADGLDFSAATGTLTFAPGETTKTFSVDVIGDSIYEGTEEFDLELSSSTATVPGSLAPVSIQITDDDAKPTVTFGSMTMAEGNGGSVAVFPVKLSNAASTNVEFTVADIPGVGPGGATTSASSAPAPGALDYMEPPTTAFVPAGQTTGYVYFLVNGDDVFEPTESMQVELTPIGTNVALAQKTATLTLTNDDTAPSIEVTSATVTEGDKVQVKFTTVGVSQDTSIYSVSFRGASVNGSVAASADDYTDPGTVLVYVTGGTPSGATNNVGQLMQITDDTTSEGPETILATGTALGAGKVIDGVITIAASDGGVVAPAPTLTSAASYRLGVGSLKLSGTAAAGATVTLWGTPIGADEDKPWQSLGTTTASTPDGDYSFFPEFTTTGWWFRTAVGALESEPVKVNLKEDPDLYVRSSSRGVATLSVFGDPRVAGLSVRILRANSNGTWSTVGLGQLDANGKYVKVLTGLRSGASYLYKATVYGDGDVGLLTNTSMSLRLRIR